MNKPLVSLICGGLNVEKFVNRCFTSVLQQTYENVEFIFINDGSTDNTSEIVEKFVREFKNKGYVFKIVNQKNMGFYPQSGIKISTGKYICTLDADDVLLPESIEKRVSFLEKNPDFVAVRTNGFIVNENNLEDTSKLFVTDEGEKKETNIFEDLLYGKTNNWAGSYMIKAYELFKIYPDKIVPMNRYGQNLQILMPVAYRNKTGFIDEPLMKYIKNESSFTMSANNFEAQIKQAEEFKNIRLSILELLELKNIQFIEKLNLEYNKTFLDIAFSFNKKVNYNKFYIKLEKKTIQDKINFHRINNNIFSHYIFRILKYIYQKL